MVRIALRAWMSQSPSTHAGGNAGFRTMSQRNALQLIVHDTTRPTGPCHGTGWIRQKYAIVNGSFGPKSFTMANFWRSSWCNRSRWRFFGLTMANSWRIQSRGWHGRLPSPPNTLWDKGSMHFPQTARGREASDNGCESERINRIILPFPSRAGNFPVIAMLGTEEISPHYVRRDDGGGTFVEMTGVERSSKPAKRMRRNVPRAFRRTAKARSRQGRRPPRLRAFPDIPLGRAILQTPKGALPAPAARRHARIPPAAHRG